MKKNFLISLSSIIVMFYSWMSPRAMAGKRRRVKLGNLRAVPKDGSEAVPRDSGAPVPPRGLEEQEKRVLTGTRDRAVWRGLPARRNQCQPHSPVSCWCSPLDKCCQTPGGQVSLWSREQDGEGLKEDQEGAWQLFSPMLSPYLEAFRPSK